MQPDLKLFLFLIFSISFGYSITLGAEDAAKKISPYAFSGEALDIKPTQVVYFEGKEYWVVELKSLGEIYALFVVDANTGEIFAGPGSKIPMKIHYLANKFQPESTFDSYLGESLSTTRNFQTNLESKKSEIKDRVQSTNISFSEYNDLMNAIENGIKKAENSAQIIITLQNEMRNITSEAAFNKVITDVRLYFDTQSAFYASLDTVLKESEDFKDEISEKQNNGEITPEMAFVLKGSASFDYGKTLKDMKDKLNSTKNTINLFLDSIDEKVGLFYAKMLARLNASEPETQKQKMIERINNLITRHSYLVSSANKLSQDCLEKLNVISKLNSIQNFLTKAREICGGLNTSACLALSSELDKMELLANQVNASLKKGCEEEQPIEEQKEGVNWLLVGGIIAILVFIFIFFYMKKGEGEERVEQSSPWAYFER
ncbi:MAG: hypothetical protein QW735_02500 [archaeon]